MNQPAAEGLAREREALLAMYEQGQIDADVYYKSLVRLAAEYAAIREYSAAHEVVSGIAEDYVKNKIAGQMGEDPLFRQMAVSLAEDLVEGGLVQVGEQFWLYKPGGNA